MAKNIIFCADGTWNAPNSDENSDGIADPTNVYKLFLQLTGSLVHSGSDPKVEQEKTLSKGGEVMAVAKYLHGVGDSDNLLAKSLGGAFGAGIITRIVRGYTFISRNFAIGDNIFIIGFSRGAYTARALGGLIASQGLLDSKIVGDDKNRAYNMGVKAWYEYRKSKNDQSFFARLAENVSILAGLLDPANADYDKSKQIPVASIACIAVWDTVGSLGIPISAGKGKTADDFRFADAALSQKVACGLHAVALDEQRSNFTPTLWDPAPNVTQVLFPGAHADVGGGYPAINGESGLSDGALAWMMGKLAALGVDFSSDGAYPCASDSKGTAHKPWKHGVWPILGQGPRTFPDGMAKDPSITDRMAVDAVRADPHEAPAPYRPTNLPT